MPSLLAPAGIVVPLGVSEDLESVNLAATTVTRFVKRQHLDRNSTRSDFLDAVVFMENVVGDEGSVLDSMICPNHAGHQEGAATVRS